MEMLNNLFESEVILKSGIDNLRLKRKLILEKRLNFYFN